MKYLLQILFLGLLLLSLLILNLCRKEKLPVLSTSAISNITATTATSGGNITSDGGVEVTARGVCLDLDGNPSISDTKTEDGIGEGKFVSTLDGLTAGSTYHVRAYATNSVGTAYGDDITFVTASAISPSGSRIIANHNIVDKFDDIPLEYINEVKKMLVDFTGESHANAYRKGMELLEALYPAYDSNISTGEAPTSSHLRVNNGLSTGEEEWFTWYAYATPFRPLEKDYIKNYINEYATHGHPFSVLGFAWCWDMVSGSIGSTIDPIFGCGWYGRSAGGPQGNTCWGLDAEDYALTANTICLDTYLSATQDYIAYCKANGFSIKVVFTTGTVDNNPGEHGYQGYLKNERIRNFVAADSTRILFDYADILCYDDNGSLTTTSWNGHVYPVITTINLGSANTGHIGAEGAIRLAKAQWWMLARIAGWDGN